MTPPKSRRPQMPKVSKDSVEAQDHGVVLDYTDEVDGYTVDFVTFREDLDHTPLLVGLPDDRCQCPHWGYVLNGRVTYRFADREEVFEAGDAFYLPPGHVPVSNEPGSEILQFSPTDALQETATVIMKNMEAMQAG
jgi:mannose-6-phosphate isomerase-like protein (cupin superfamily)